MEPTLIVMVGISGSGKSTFANGLKTSLGATVVETDAIRLELTGNAEDQTQNGRVFATARNRVDNLLKQGKTVVIDATSLTRRDRKEWVEIAKKNGARVRAFVVQADLATAKKRNATRERQVPEWVIDKQFAKFSVPSESEGFDSIKIV